MSHKSHTPHYIYIAGPYTGPPGNIANIRKAILVGSTILNHGGAPYIPHLTGLWDLVSPHELEDWLRYDKEWLKKCDTLFRLSGHSPGADAEVKMARALEIPIYHGLNHLISHMQSPTTCPQSQP